MDLEHHQLEIRYEALRVRRPGKERQVTGTGLGLVISRQIVEAHNGKIWVESQNNVGTTFLFTLPAATKEQQEVQGD